VAVGGSVDEGVGDGSKIIVLFGRIETLSPFCILELNPPNPGTIILDPVALYVPVLCLLDNPIFLSFTTE
jgi:hypothetical protein